MFDELTWQLSSMAGNSSIAPPPPRFALRRLRVPV